MMARHQRKHFKRNVQGLTLIELMISMALGTLVVIAAAGVYLTNLKTYWITAQVQQFQDAQPVFEMMVRDIRGATFSPCNANPKSSSGKAVDPVTHNLVTAGWQEDWNKIVYGVSGVVGGERVDRIQVVGPSGLFTGIVGRYNRLSTPTTTDPLYVLYDSSRPFIGKGDFVVVCTLKEAFRFRVGSIRNDSNAWSFRLLDHKAEDGNCSSEFVACGGGVSGGAPVIINQGAMVYQVQVREWFVADNGRGGRSLFMKTDGKEKNEVLSGVKSLELSYYNPAKNRDDFVPAAQIGSGMADWQGVKAVRVRLILQQEKEQEGRRISREFSSIVAIRSRLL